MAINDLFSKRARRERGEVPDVFSYSLPNKLRTQIFYIILDTVGRDKVYGADFVKIFYQNMNKILCREYGVLKLNDRNDNEASVLTFFMETNEAEKALDVVELIFRFMNHKTEIEWAEYYSYVDAKISINSAIHELNERFKENGVGYSFESNRIIKVDSTAIHQEITKPVLKLLHNPKFSGANEEYLNAHKHYREGNNKECLGECLKAFESTMKIICKEKGWRFDETDTAKKLIQICYDNNLVPPFIQSEISALKSVLESGVPTIRNKKGGHGQGQTPVVVNSELARYCMNLTGANIIYLVEQADLK